MLFHKQIPQQRDSVLGLVNSHHICNSSLVLRYCLDVPQRHTLSTHSLRTNHIYTIRKPKIRPLPYHEGSTLLVISTVCHVVVRRFTLYKSPWALPSLLNGAGQVYQYRKTCLFCTCTQAHASHKQKIPDALSNHENTWLHGNPQKYYDLIPPWHCRFIPLIHQEIQSLSVQFLTQIVEQSIIREANSSIPPMVPVWYSGHESSYAYAAS